MTKTPEADDTRRIIDRCERVMAELQDRKDDLKAILDEAGSNGHDKAALRKVLARRAKLEKNAAKVAEEDAMIEMYLTALGA